MIVRIWRGLPLAGVIAGLTALAAVLLAGCAKAYAPPGGEQDRTPPRLVSTTPEALAVVPGFNQPIVFTFDETLAEQGINNATVVVSPQPQGNVEIERHGNRIAVKSPAGWTAGQVYRVLVRPGIGDRFGNRRTDALEIVFSTGPPIESTAFAGLVTDRLTGRAAADAAIEAVRAADSAVYTTDADSAGFFALRSVPSGVYAVRAYFDSNRNRRRDPSEAVSAQRPVTLTPTDTVTAEFVLLPADTTGPRLTRAEVVDSLHVKVGFDDYLDPEGISSPTVQVERLLPDSTSTVVGFTGLVLANRYRPAPPADSAAVPDSARAARPDSARAAQEPVSSLPDRDVIITLAAPLVPGTRYRVTITAVRNVNGLAGGGGGEFAVPPSR
ncbi:MAG TPA: Ig-like domain-containing protein [Longimicrobiales bacterium]